MQRVLHNPPDSQLYRYDSASRLINYVRGGNDMEFRRFSVTGTTFGIVK